MVIDIDFSKCYESLLFVETRRERFSLKKDSVREGDVVYQVHPRRTFVVMDTSNLDNESGYGILYDSNMSSTRNVFEVEDEYERFHFPRVLIKVGSRIIQCDNNKVFEVVDINNLDNNSGYVEIE